MRLLKGEAGEAERMMQDPGTRREWDTGHDRSGILMTEDEADAV